MSTVTSNRYARQIQVNHIGLTGQAKIASASVLIIGMGGLGCQIGAHLAGAGVGSLTLVDHDQIDISNLHRQTLYRESDIGLPKVKVAARELASLNSDISISAQCCRVTADNLSSLAIAVDLVIDAADNFATTYLLSDYCFEQRIPLITASVNRTFGYVGIFCGSQENPAPSVRAMFPRIPAEQLSCDEVGVTGPSVGVIASMQAQEAVKVIVGDDAQLLGKLLYLDVWTYKQHTVDFSKAVEPTQNQIQFLGEAEINDKDVVIDVRNLSETQAAPLNFTNNLHIPLLDIQENFSKLPTNTKLVCVCKSGQRALMAAQQLISLGVQEVAVLVPN